MTTPLKGDLKMNKESVIDLLAVGDLILDEPAPMAPYFASSKPVLQSADLLIGHVETPHTDRGVASSIDLQAPPSRPEHLDVLKEMGFHIATLAGNHIYDCGTPGVVDTYDKLTSLGIIPQGAGANIHVAKEPAIVERAGVWIGVISFNAVGPKFSWATSQKAGCAYLNVLTHYEQRQATPGGTYPPAMYTFVDPISQMEMKRDIEALKSQCDIAVVALHKGAAGAMGALEMYERPLAWAAVDAGADILTVHVEATTHLHRTIQEIKSYGIKAGISLNPATPLSSIEYVLDDIDLILIMTVNPGFGGQSFIESMIEKIQELKKLIDEKNLNVDIQVDGGIKPSNIHKVVEAGANVIVAGSAIFNSENIEETVKLMRKNASF